MDHGSYINRGGIMKKIISILVTGTLISGLAGCAQPGQPGGITNAAGGTVLGGILGGLAGTQIGHGQGTTVAIIGGTLLGAFLGNRLGNALDQQSQIAANEAAQTAMDTGRTQVRHTRQATIIVKPHHRYREGHRICRNFTTNVEMSGGTQVVHGVACRDSQGVWRIQQ